MGHGLAWSPAQRAATDRSLSEDLPTAVSPENLPPRIVLYDGHCGLCDKSVQWLLARDPSGALHFAALQGPTAASIRARHPEIPRTIDSVLFVERRGARELVRWRSRAVLAALAHVQSPWRHARVLGVIPAPLLDLGYRLIARVRLAIWGRLDVCRVPRPEERARFLP